MATPSFNVTTQKNDAFSTAADIRLQRMLEMAPDSSAPVNETTPLEPPRPARRQSLKVSRRTLVLILGVVALVLLALLTGWVIGSLNQPTRAAWQSSPAYERMYLSMIADKYARTGDALQAQRDLAGARPEDIARTLDAMQREVNDATRRQRLVALADTVRPPVSQTSYVPLLFGQPAFLLSLLLSLSPMFAALVLIVVPYIRERIRPASEHADEEHVVATEASAAELEALLADVNLDAPVAGTPDVVEQKNEDAAKEEEKKKEEEEEEEEEKQEDGGLGDLASLFEEEDTSLAALENFCKGLPEINVDVLIANAKSAAQTLKDAIARRG
ncbi:MAG: hypothetical protein HY868_11435 [Chloroflexi bacterium]|nr:hypothetical protein [Chloroflexota bacterium]